jgi:hypothetical protein
MTDGDMNSFVDEQVEEVLLSLNKPGTIVLRESLRPLLHSFFREREQTRHIKELERVASIQSAYKKDMENTISTLAAIVGVCDADALIAKVALMHDALDSALNVLLGSCIPAGGIDDAEALLATKRQLRKALGRDPRAPAASDSVKT